jgi:hypothetical protein
MLISVEGTGKGQLEPSQRAWEMLQCGHIVLCQEIFDLNCPVCWSFVVKEKLYFGPPIFGAFPSTYNPKATI